MLRCLLVAFALYSPLAQYQMSVAYPVVGSLQELLSAYPSSFSEIFSAKRMRFRKGVKPQELVNVLKGTPRLEKTYEDVPEDV